MSFLQYITNIFAAVTAVFLLYFLIFMDVTTKDGEIFILDRTATVSNIVVVRVDETVERVPTPPPPVITQEDIDKEQMENASREVFLKLMGVALRELEKLELVEEK